MVLNYLAKEVEKYGVLHLTDKGRAFIGSPGPLMLANQRDFSDVDSGDSLAQTRGDSGGAGFQPVACSRTSARKSAQGCPYVIFQTSVWTNGHALPTSPDELLRIMGGSGKAAKFGEPFTHSRQEVRPRRRH